MNPSTRVLGIAAVAMALGMNRATQAGLYDFSASGSGHYTAGASGLGQAIPDNNPSGVAYALNFGAGGLRITDISVTFTTVGGWNGDIYAYLSHGDGFAVLLNRVGVNTSGADGYGTAGFTSITLAMSAVTDIHGVAVPTAEGGPYAADGRVAYDNPTRDHGLGVFNATDPNGSWTLFFADMAPGSQGTLVSWGVDLGITAVPEPLNVALGCFAGVLLVVAVVRSCWARRLFRRVVPVISQHGERR